MAMGVLILMAMSVLVTILLFRDSKRNERASPAHHGLFGSSTAENRLEFPQIRQYYLTEFSFIVSCGFRGGL